jgi:hypothetical protein
LAYGIIKGSTDVLGLVGPYRKLIPNLGVLTSPLNLLARLSKPKFKKYIKIEMNKSTILIAIDMIKGIIISDPYFVLGQKDIDTFIIKIDISNVGIDMILL